MTEDSIDLLSKITSTETWKKWGEKYLQQLYGVGEKPYSHAKAHLTPIPPDTYASLMQDLHEETGIIPFIEIVEELSPEGINSILEHQCAFASVAVMHFFLTLKD